jgi:hypothetical protein
LLVDTRETITIIKKNLLLVRATILFPSNKKQHNSKESKLRLLRLTKNSGLKHNLGKQKKNLMRQVLKIETAYWVSSSAENIK